MTVQNFVRIATTVFEKNEKVHKWLFFGQFWQFLKSQPYDINVIAHTGPPLSVKWLSKISFESLRQFLKNIVTVHNWLFLGQFRLCFSNPSLTMLITLHRYVPRKVEKSCRNFRSNCTEFSRRLQNGSE